MPTTHSPLSIADAALHAELDDRLAHLERRPQRAQRVVLVHRRDAEDGHDRVADELLDDAAVPLGGRPHPLEVRREHRAHDLGVERLAEQRRVGDVGEEHRDDLALRARAELGRRGGGELDGAAATAARLGRRSDRRVERGVLEQDRLLELLQRLARIEAELVAAASRARPA